MPIEAATYRVKVWAKSTADTYAHLLARDEASTDGSFLGGAYNLPIGTAISPLEMEFTSTGERTAELMLNLGRITPNPDNPEDTTPSDFTVTIDKIEIYKITGEQTQTPVYTADFSGRFDHRHRRGRRFGHGHGSERRRHLPNRRLPRRGRRCLEHQGRYGPARYHAERR